MPKTKLKESNFLDRDVRKSLARVKNGGKLFESRVKSKDAGKAVKKMIKGMEKKGK